MHLNSKKANEISSSLWGKHMESPACHTRCKDLSCLTLHCTLYLQGLHLQLHLTATYLQFTVQIQFFNQESPIPAISTKAHHCIVLYCIVLYCIVLYLLYRIVLYCLPSSLQSPRHIYYIGYELSAFVFFRSFAAPSFHIPLS